MSMTLVHDKRGGSAQSEARLMEDGIEAMLEHRDRMLAVAASTPSAAIREAAQMKADDLSAEAGIQRFRLLAFMLANRVGHMDKEPVR